MGGEAQGGVVAGHEGSNEGRQGVLAWGGSKESAEVQCSVVQGKQ